MLVPCDVAADVLGPSVSPAQRRVSPGRKWRVSPSDRLFLQNKEIIRRMTAGLADWKPGGARGSPASPICHPALAGAAPLCHRLPRKVNNSSAVRLSRRSLLSVSHSVLLLIFLFLSLISCAYLPLGLPPAHVLPGFLRSQWMRSASKPLKYSDMQTPKPRTASLGLKAPGSGGDPWQSRRVAATLGPRLLGLLGANSSLKSPTSISSKKPSLTSVCQRKAANEPEDFRAREESAPEAHQRFTSAETVTLEGRHEDKDLVLG